MVSILSKLNSIDSTRLNDPYYYLKLEESLRELDPDTDPNHAILVEKSKNIFLKTMESRYKMRIINLTGFLKKRGIIK